MDISESEAGSVFVILSETAASAEPSEGPLDNPSFGQNLEADRLIGSFDDLQLPGTERFNGGSRDRPLITAIGKDFLDERKQPAHDLEHEQAAIPILDAGGVNHDAHGQTQRVDQDMSLLSFDFLPRIVTRRVDLRPPFSAPLTLWLSMIAAVGLASLPDCSRTATKSA